MTNDTDLVLYRAEQLVELMPELKTIVMQDDEDAALDIARGILEAKTSEEALSEGGADKARELFGVPLEVHGFKLRPSDMDEGVLRAYALMDAVNLETGERIAISSGALNVVCQLIWHAREGSFPFRAKLTPAKTSKPGRSAPYRFVGIT